jgi:hypothetical protein
VTRLLAALLWMRWRLSRRNLFGAARRDPLERLLGLSEALLAATRAIAIVVGAGFTCLVAALVGWSAASARPADAVGLTVVLGNLAAAAAVLAPLVVGPRDRPAVLQRLQLLPIHPRDLHRLHVFGGAAEPTFALAAPALVVFPLGLLAGGRPLAAAAMLLLALPVALLVLALSSVAGDVAALVMQDRRRAETAVMAMFLLTLAPAAAAPLLGDGEPHTAWQGVGPALRAAAAWGTPGGLYASALQGALQGQARFTLGAAVLLAAMAGA